jgi:hypothetical protein
MGARQLEELDVVEARLGEQLADRAAALRDVGAVEALERDRRDLREGDERVDGLPLMRLGPGEGGGEGGGGS